MQIRINGADADIRPETEKTVGEVLAALEGWLSESGYRLSGLQIDGENIGVNEMDASFAREINKIGTLDIGVSALRALIAESLSDLLQDINDYDTASYEERLPFAAAWQKSPAANLLAEQCPDLHSWAYDTFSGEGAGATELYALTEERLREFQDTNGEMEKISPLVAEICARMEDLPLDMQTGKDARAADTVNLFSGITEKVLRIFSVLKITGLPMTGIMVENMLITDYIEEFNTALQELLAAYEARDTVLAGDIAEYEMAPRLRNLYSAIVNGIGVRSV